MKRSLLAAMLFLAAVLLLACKRGEVYPLRWVYISTGLGNDTELERVKGLIKTGAEHGLSGIYLSSGFDALDLKDEDYLRRLHEVRRYCDSLKMDIAARCMDVGYNGSLFAHNPNLAEGLPVNDALFVAGKAEAVRPSAQSRPGAGTKRGDLHWSVRKALKLRC